MFISQTVKDLVAGSGLTFADAGEHELKGVPGPLATLRRDLIEPLHVRSIGATQFFANSALARSVNALQRSISNANEENQWSSTSLSGSRSWNRPAAASLPA